MRTRRLGPFAVSAVGLGCMSLSHAYGAPPPADEGARLLNRALDLGYTFLDTAALYGFGANETLVGDALAGRRGEYVLASKCGMFKGADGKREIDGRPETLKRTCEDSLRRLKTEVIDLYYLHRWDRDVPIEDSVGALADLVAEGKVRTLGLSEVSADTLRRAHAVHPIAAVQSEYSLWTRNPEVAVLDACRELGTAFVAFSPLARGFLAGGVMDAAALPHGDIRTFMPRFQGAAFAHNRALLNGFIAAAREAGCTPAQAALAWVLSRGEDVIPIPGTTRLDHLEENAGADAVTLDAATLAKLDELINPRTVEGPRYNAATQAEIDTEELPA
ncbi:aldo/keto reductase [Phenylobacterium sp.]|jgi:aryl-alcohol dehydrogenase-like predicted oxidoreductase|uniref:aldo/keto reductase n=1 Tax=Phenylobacterium sp. TaxID=1871053 RepID=UPI003782E696